MTLEEIESEAKLVKEAFKNILGDVLSEWHGKWKNKLI